MMRTIALFCTALALAGCSNPLEELWPAQKFAIEDAGRTYDIRTQYDPFERKWWTRVSVTGGRLEPDDRFTAFRIVQDQVGPKVCDDGAKIEVKPQKIWTRHGAETIRYLPENGTWILVGACV